MNKNIIALTVVLLLGVSLVGAPYVNFPFLHNSSIPVASAAAVDYFLTIDGVSGESMDHPGAIELNSWSWGETNSSGHGGGGGAGKVSMQDFHFTMKTSKASPKLMLAVASGEHFKKAVLMARKPGGDRQDYLIITLSDVLVTSYQVGGSNGDVPTDEISINFSKIEFEYRTQNADGSAGEVMKAGWDLGKNKKI